MTKERIPPERAKCGGECLESQLFERLRQKNYHVFEDSLAYIVGVKPARVTQRDPVSACLPS